MIHRDPSTDCNWEWSPFKFLPLLQTAGGHIVPLTLIHGIYVHTIFDKYLCDRIILMEVIVFNENIIFFSDSVVLSLYDGPVLVTASVHPLLLCRKVSLLGGNLLLIHCEEVSLYVAFTSGCSHKMTLCV